MARIRPAIPATPNAERAASFTYPMDGTLVQVALDICGRRNLVYNLSFGNFTIGNLDPNLFKEFFKKPDALLVRELAAVIDEALYLGEIVFVHHGAK